MASITFYHLKEIIEDESIPRDEIADRLAERYPKHSVYISADVPEWETLDERNQYMKNLLHSGLSIKEIGERVDLQQSRVREIVYSYESKNLPV